MRIKDPSKIKGLIACEYSGTVREAFSKLGFNVWSCDLLDSEVPGNHIKGNVIDILSDGWDFMIGHPPCKYLSYAGGQCWNDKGRVFKRLEALKFFAQLWEAPIKFICLENPKSCASPVISKYSQEIQPYYFGDPQMKTTWLWLRNLPLLHYSKENNLFGQKSILDKPEPFSITKGNKKRYFVDGPTRDPKERARFWPGIAKAMAEQWSSHIINNL